MSVYWSDQYTCDFSPYFRMFFAVKHIYLTLYIAYMCRIAPIYSAPLYLLALLAVLAAACCSRPPDARRSCSLSVLFAALACPRPCGRACVRVRACAWALSAYLPVACRAFYSPIMYILRRYARPARRVSAPPQTFSRSFSSCRYLFSCRPQGWVTRLDIAVWADLAVLRCFDDLLTSRDIKKIFFKGVDSLRPPCYDVHVNRKDTHDRPRQARHTRPTDERMRVTDGRNLTSA